MDPVYTSMSEQLAKLHPVDPNVAPVVETVAPVVETPVAPVAVETPITPVVETVAPVVETPVAVETPVIPAVETPAAPVETKEWYETEATPPPLNNTSGPIDPIFEDDQVKLFVEARKAGKTLADFVAEYQVPDYSKYSDEQVVDHMLSQMFPDQERFEQAKATFEGYDIFQQNKQISEFRNSLNAVVQDKQKLLIAPIEANRLREQEIATRFNSDLDQTVTGLIDQEYNGLKITADIANDLKDYISSKFTLNRPDGSIDVQKMFNLAFWDKYAALTVKANVQKAKNEGRKEVLSTITNPTPLPSQTAAPNTGAGDLQAAMQQYVTRK